MPTSRRIQDISAWLNERKNYRLEPDEIMPPPPGRSSELATLWLAGDGYWYCTACWRWHRDLTPEEKERELAKYREEYE